MKKLTLIVLTIFALFNSACHPDKCCSPTPPLQFITAQKNGVSWTADPSSSNIQGDAVALFGTNFTSSIEETLTIQFKVSGTGNYPLKNTPTLYYNTIGRDVFTSRYHLDDSFANSVNVTNYDPNTNTISGTFSLKLKRVYPDSVNNAQNTLQFLEGKFNMALHK
jgi:hypothetical protein